MVQSLSQKLVHTTHPYLYQRGRCFYFRYVPADAHKAVIDWLPTEIRYSLRTKDIDVALFLMKKRRKLISLIRLANDFVQLGVLYNAIADQSLDVSSLVSYQITDEIPPELYSKLASKRQSSSIRLHEAWRRYVKSKDWTDKTSSTNQQMFENVLHFIGDKQISDIQKSDIRVCLQQIAQLPRRNMKGYSGKSLAEVTKFSVPEEHRLSAKTVREHLKLMQGLFSTYLVRELELLEKSPTDGVRWQYDDSRFGSFADSQVRSVLLKSEGKPEWFRVLLLLAVYSGARRSELGRLRVSDIFRCEDTGIDYFIVRQGKTASAQRRVPIHSVVLDSGFTDYVASCDDYLFPQARNNLNRITDLFGSLLDESYSEFGERLTFHSIRHSFVTKARSKGVDISLLQDVIGHARTGAGITDRYTHHHGLLDLSKTVESVKY